MKKTLYQLIVCILLICTIIIAAIAIYLKDKVKYKETINPESTISLVDTIYGKKYIVEVDTLTDKVVIIGILPTDSYSEE